jgi:monovalent cation:H+ antiporter-2, CPA2 family
MVYHSAMDGSALDTTIYKQALVVLGAAAIVIPLFHRLRISSVLGFILIGVAVGPYGIAALAPVFPWVLTITISDAAAIEPIARLGVVLLLFMIGLEMSIERLWLMRRLVFGLGTLQVMLCATVLAGGAFLAGQDLSTAAVMGTVLAMSSTAVVLQILSEARQLGTEAGRSSFAILLFQDLAVVPILFALGALGPVHHTGSARELGSAIGRAVLAVVIIVAVGRLVLRPLFRSVARTRSDELFVAACLMVVIATGLAAASAGLSMAVGALIGGLLLAGTEYRRQVEVTIDPFKGLFIGVFLISVGMSLDLRIVAAHPLFVLVAAVGMVVVKTAVIMPLARLFRLSWGSGLRAGLLLGPGGEFGLVMVSVAQAEGLLEPGPASILLFVTALTMATIPLLSAAGERLVPGLGLHKPVDASLMPPDVTEASPRVIVAGYGRVGQTVASMLEAHKIPFVAIDSDADRVARQRRRGVPVYFGDMTQIRLLRRLHLENARALVVTLDDAAVAEALVKAARSERSDLIIVARARDARHAARLYKAGASDAVPETIEASLQLSEAALIDLGVPMGPVIASIHEKRASLQSDIKALAPDARLRLLGRARLRDRAPRPAEGEPRKV